MNLPAIPTDREIYEGEIATYWFEGEVLVSRSKSIKRTVELIRNNLAFVQKITNNKPVPLLIYLTNSPVPDKETRKYSSEAIPKIYSRMAMVSDAGLSMLIMKMVFALKKPPVPTRSFTNALDALNWLRGKEYFVFGLPSQ